MFCVTIVDLLSFVRRKPGKRIISRLREARMNADFANIEGMFKTNTDIVKKAIAEVPAERWFLRPGDNSNHLMWVAGHLVWSRGLVLRWLGVEWMSPRQSLFERGAKLTTPDRYPAVEEILAAWDDVSVKLLASLRAAGGDFLGRPAPKGPPSLDGKISGLVAFLAFHETYHVGQLSYLRKWLGYGQSVG
jgi:DinB superfamily